MFAPPSSQSAFCSLAQASHAQLAQALTELAGIEEAAKRRSDWLRLEPALLGHLRAEEEVLLSDFDLALPEEATRVREEHQRIRQLLVDVREAADAGHVDAALLSDLGASLASSAANEERVLYPWAEHCLRPRKKREFLHRASSPEATARRKFDGFTREDAFAMR